MTTSKIGIVAGRGALPDIIIKDLKKQNVEFYIVLFEKDLYEKFSIYETFHAKYENIIFLLDYLKQKEIKKLIFVGYFRRPVLELNKFDNKSLDFLMPAIEKLKSGDNNLFKAIIKIFEDYGMIVLDPFVFSPHLLEGEKNLTLKKPNEENMRDISIAYKIFNSISSLDLGQSLVVAEGLCLAIETLPGTDHMLDFVKNYKIKSLTESIKSGILFKSQKINQETKIDMPVIGPDTIKKVKEANLDGIALQKKSVIIIDKKKSILLANDLKIFICSLNFEKLNYE